MVRILVTRGAKERVPDFVKAVRDEDAAVRTEALRALGILADAPALPPLVKLMLEAKTPGERRAAEKAVIAVAGRVEDANQRTRAMLDALPTVKGEAKASLIRVVGRFGGPEALEAITAAVKDPEPAVQDAAIRTLAGWPDASPAATLLDLAKNAESLTHRVLALRGYVNVVALDGASPAATILQRYEDAMAIAKRVEDKKLVLAGIASVRHPDALKVLERYQADPALKAEADAAIQKVKDAMKAPAKVTASHNAGNAKNAIDGNMKTRWDTGAAMRGGEWFVIELAMEQQVTSLTLDTRGSNGDYPRGYEVYLSRDGKNWGKPVVTGQGKGPVTEIAIEPTFGRYIKIVQTGKTNGLFWSIHELKVETK
jgi:hypothetical protein